ncbi:MAG: L-2-hydroxyglutarate oxidase [Chloroflexota bacterium]
MEQPKKSTGASTYDVLIVGGGIVGLATARALLHREPRLRLAILEKEAEIARHQSGHNSGVIHSGIYYMPGSFKAEACVAGHDAVIEFCREKGIPFELCGKVIVALDESELPRLNDLFKRGTTNGVQGLELIGPERLRELEPYAVGVQAIYSPNTGIVDYRKVAQAYADDIRAAGSEIITGCEVHAIRPGKPTVLQIGSGSSQRELRANFVITCGGLHSDQLVGMMQPKVDPRIVPFRGDYYVFHPEKRSMVNGLIYPVPDPRFPFLGVHFTRVMNGEVWAGPNAVLAFAREGYGRWDMLPKDLAQILTYGGFWRMAAKYWRMGLSEMIRDYSKAAYVKELQRYMPALQADDLLPGPSGVRAQALAGDGRLIDDFLIRRDDQVLHVQNAPSPAATSSLIIARKIVAEVPLQMPT